jgi:hypothetical protein
MTNLPTEVVQQDRTLQKAADDLAQLRWHWTLDESNPDRVSFREYARQVGVHKKSVGAMANGYAAYITAGGGDVPPTPGEPQSVTDHIELANMGAERQDAVKAVAKATGASVDAEQSRWVINRLQDTERRVQTIAHVLEVAVNSLDGRTNEGKKARIYHLHIKRAQEEVALLSDAGAQS